MEELYIARRCRGLAISSITRLEKHVLEDEVAIKGYIKQLENLDSDFKG